MINGVWISPEEGLSPLDEEYGHCSEEVAIVLKSGVVVRGLKDFSAGDGSWIICDGKESKLKEGDIAFWITMPSLRRS